MYSSLNKKSNNIFKIIFIIIVFFIAISSFIFIYKRYSFSNEKVNLESYIGVNGDDVAIFLNDSVMLNKGESNVNSIAVKMNGTVYIPLSFVKEFINNRFYYAKDLNKILYCLPDEIKSYGDTDIHQIGNVPYVVFKDEPYLLIDYIKDYTNIRYDIYINDENKRIYLYDNWEIEEYAYLKSKESVRLLGGNKAPIITKIKKGDEVKILNKMTKWLKIKTSNGYIGYIRKRKIHDENERIPISNFTERNRKNYKLDYKPCIGFHQLYSNYNSTKLAEVMNNSDGMNVIAPTWFVIKNNNGEIRSIANESYIKWCHDRHLKVWATLNNFDITDINEKKVFSSAVIRKKIIDRILNEVEINNLDGINLDIEQVDIEAGEHYIEFVRELSIALNKIDCILSVDTYVPYKFNKHYNLKELNDFCDYVIIMCYDEHYSGSTETGSVSSIGYVKDGINLSLIDVDKDKLIIALPFYSRIWTTHASGKVTSTAYGSDACKNVAVSHGIRFSFDDTTCQYYGSKITETGNKIECWLEDETSLKYKIDEVKKANVGGTAAWKLTQEKEGFFKLININE